MFENTVLSVAEITGISGAYFAYGTLWIPRSATNDAKFPAFSEHFNNDIWVSKTADEWAVDFAV
jgi:hypothetical protein